MDGYLYVVMSAEKVQKADKESSFPLEGGSTLREKGDGGDAACSELAAFTLTRSKSSDLSPQGRGEDSRDSGKQK